MFQKLYEQTIKHLSLSLYSVDDKHTRFLSLYALRKTKQSIFKNQSATLALF